MKSIKLLLCLPLAAMSVSAAAQGTLDDYNRAYGLGKQFGYGHVDNANVRPAWIADSDAFWYVEEADGSRTYTVMDAKSGKKTPLFDHQALASALANATGNQMKGTDLRLERVRPTAKRDTIRFVYSGRNYAWPAKKGGMLADMGPVPERAPQPHWMVVDEEKEWGPVPSPDGSMTAFVRDNNLWVKDAATGNERQLTTDGTLANYYSSWIQWSPDGKKFATTKIRPVEKRFVYYVESSPAQGSQPILHKQEYAKPGDELRQKLPVIADVATGEVLRPDNSLFASQYDLYGPTWNADSRGVTFEYNERGHKVYRVLEMSAADGGVRTLIEESHPKYVNYSRIFRHYLGDGKHIIWSSERDNRNHLYMYDRDTALPVAQITKGEWYLRDVVHVDENHRKIYFTANGFNPDEDPYFIRYFSVNFDGSGLTDLTPSEGTHQASFSPDFKYLVDTYSTVSEAPVTVVRSAVDGRVIHEVARADLSSLKEKGWKAPEVFVAPGRDGETPMWGLIYRPMDFDPAKKYPVIEYIYQGPGDQYVQKSFRGFNQTMQALAELGFICVMVDGMGTSFRTREFESVCYKNLADAGLPDHISWIKAAASKYPYMDIDRVGIFGASAGGQESTAAVLQYPDFYKAAYSACGCHDNRMDKIWWNEQWLGYPIDESYLKASNVENAHKLQVPLMLVVGELDDNVDPASTMQVADALIKAGKDFDLVVLPGVHHTLGESFGEHKRFDFFVRHLLGVNPPAWKDITY